MRNSTYSQNVKALKNEIYSTKISELEINGLIWSYLMVSSNLSTFLPLLKDDTHYKIIQDMQFHRSLSGIELLYPSLLENTIIYDESNVIEQSSKRGHIFVSYHAGSYNLSLRYLVHKKIPFCAVANNEYINEHKVTVQKLYNDVPNKNIKNLQIFSAEDPKLLLKLTKILNEGISVYIFIDGNSGTKKNDLSKDKNLLKIDFLNHHIYARQGVAYLAYLSKAPIATIVAYRDKELNNTVKIDVIETNAIIQKYCRSDFINLITQKLYSKLEIYLKTNYEQWSGWFYLHNFFDTESFVEKMNQEKGRINYKVNKLILNQFVHLLKHDDENIFLVMKKKYKIMKIKEYLFDVLSYFKTPKKIIPKKPLTINNQKVNWNFIKELVEMNYLKPIQ